MVVSRRKFGIGGYILRVTCLGQKTTSIDERR
jgi:hypothetical protein